MTDRDGPVRAAKESWRYSYDGFGHLLLADNLGDDALAQSFTFTRGGNLTLNSRVGTYIYGAAGSPRPHAVRRIEAADGTVLKAFTYDANGNMLSDGTRSFGCSRRCRLTLRRAAQRSERGRRRPAGAGLGRAICLWTARSSSEAVAQTSIPSG
ncbi:MAG: hypothetical protein R3D33_00845 [Hyphomicrobiaceae bacterium]